VAAEEAVRFALFVDLSLTPRCTARADPFLSLAGYDKLYADDSSPVTPRDRGEIYEHLGIDPQAGCVVVVRPDQVVSLVCSLDEIADVGAFFSHFMVPQQ